MSEQVQKLFVPIFEKDGNRFVVGHPDFGGADEDEAWEIGCGAALVECILWGARFTGKTLDATDNIMAVKTTLGRTRIAVISGPIFDSAPLAD